MLDKPQIKLFEEIVIQIKKQISRCQEDSG